MSLFTPTLLHVFNVWTFIHSKLKLESPYSIIHFKKVGLINTHEYSPLGPLIILSLSPMNVCQGGLKDNQQE
jgi:hypothetical protein